MNWLKLYTEFATDPKVQSMPEAMQRRLVMIFCLECSGDLPKLEDHELALAMRISPKELDETRRLFTRKGFINGTWSPKNWEKRQEPSDPGAAKRMRELRERRRQEANELREQNRNVTPNVTASVTGQFGRVTPDTRSRELELETEEEKDLLPSVPSDKSGSHAKKCESANGPSKAPKSRRPINPFADVLDPTPEMLATDPGIQRVLAEDARVAGVNAAAASKPTKKPK